jgi:hypothetical protein
MAAPNEIIPRKNVTAFKLEAVEGTAPTDAAGDAILPEAGTAPEGFGREWQDDETQTGTIGHFKPHDGGPVQPGHTIPIKFHGSGTHGVAPEIGQMMQCAFGKESVSVADTVNAAPAPTSTSFTLAGAGTAPVGHIMEVDTDGAGNYEPARVLTNVAGALTFWPPFQTVPTGTENVFAGVAYLLTSTFGEMKSGSSFTYFENGQKCILSGLKGNVTITAAVRMPLMLEFTFQGYVEPNVTPAAIGYTPAPVGFGIEYPMVRGIYFRAYYPLEVGAAATTTSIPLRNVDDTTSTMYATGTDNSGIDRLIVDVSGAGGWENKPIKTHDYATQTVTLDAGDALSGAPTAGYSAYIEKFFCINDTISFNVGHTVTALDCQGSNNTRKGQRFTDRLTEVEWSQYFTDFSEYNELKRAAFVDLWYAVGTDRGNKMYVNVPNAFRQEYALDLGGEFGIVNMTARGVQNSIGGDDEMYITIL